jgi:hypothetical protein
LVILGRIPQEIDNLSQFLLGFFLTGDVGECHLRPLWIVLLRPRTAKAEDVLLAPRHLPAHEHDQTDDEQERQERDKQGRQQRGAVGLAPDDDVVLLQER